MNDTRKHIDHDGLFWGLLLMAAGAALLLQQLGITDLSSIFRNYWPLFPILIGVSKLFHRRSLWGGLTMIAIGAWLQAVTLHFHGITYESSWPLLLLILGASMIVRAVVDSIRRHADNGEAHNG
jgi:hypothetical protein